jgi:hypothetical protein
MSLRSSPLLAASPHRPTLLQGSTPCRCRRLVPGSGHGRQVRVMFDSDDPAARAAFWAEAMHYVLQIAAVWFPSWDAALVVWDVPSERRKTARRSLTPPVWWSRVFFQRAPERESCTSGSAGRCVADGRGPSGGLEAECMRLVALRPSRVQHFEPDSFSAAFILRRIRRATRSVWTDQPGIDRGSVCQLTDTSPVEGMRRTLPQIQLRQLHCRLYYSRQCNPGWNGDPVKPPPSCRRPRPTRHPKGSP